MRVRARFHPPERILVVIGGQQEWLETTAADTVTLSTSGFAEDDGFTLGRPEVGFVAQDDLVVGAGEQNGALVRQMLRFPSHSCVARESIEQQAIHLKHFSDTCMIVE